MRRAGLVSGLMGVLVAFGACERPEVEAALASESSAPSRFEIEPPAEAPINASAAEPSGAPIGTTQEPVATANQTVDESRRTAIVRAASRVAPGVATISVISSRQVGGRDFFNRYRSRTERAASYGSGFVIDGGGGIILTNEHVVRGAERVQVTLPDGNDYEAEVVGTDALTDIGVIRIQPEGALSEVPLGTSNDLYIGEWVVAIGNPFGNLIANSEPSVTTGVVSATGRHIIPQNGDESLQLGMIQTDAAINPGNSGGPLVNVLGQVVGVNTAIFSRSGGSEGLGFAIPIDRALGIAEEILEFGEVRRAWLGIDVEPAEADDWGRTRGVLVSQVIGDSPASRAGLRAGRRILSVNGREVLAPLDWEDATLDARPGDALTLEVEGEATALRLTAGTLPSMSAERVEAIDDLQMVTITPAIASERGMSSEQGALVADISPELAQSIGLREGDVLQEIGVAGVGRARVTSAEQAAELFAQIRADYRGRTIQLVFERSGYTGTSRFSLR